MSTQRLCVTVTAATTAELRARRDAVRDADLVELRLDTVADPDVRGALAGRRLPAIVTCRAAWEGGSFAGSEEERKRLLGEALALGAEYVDIEARAGFDDLLTPACRDRVVLSMHDFEGMPRDMATEIRAMRASGAAIAKLAVTTKRLADTVALLEVAASLRGDEGHILIGMGEHGVATRVLPSRFGSAWAYAGDLAAIGQVTAAELLEVYRFRSHRASTDLFGVTGSPVGHSVSPAMHNAAFGAAGIDAVYLPLPAVDAADFVACARAFAIRGANVTIPYKVALLDRMDALSEVATRVGALNTIRVDGARWIGDNSDVNGFLAPLCEMVRPNGLRVAILGAGGAARAVAVALASVGASVRVHARNPQRAAEVAQLASGAVGPRIPERDTWDLLINCTPVGMHPRSEDTPLPAEALSPGLVYDLVYNPTDTRLIRDARRAGCRTIGGLDMLVGQARQSFEWWTGVAPSAVVMREAAMKRLATFEYDHENHVV